MKTKNMIVEYPDIIRKPEYYYQKFDYKNDNPACSQQDVDYCVVKNDKAVLIESKTWGGYQMMKPAQKQTMEVLADSPNKVYVIAIHDSPYVEGNISIVHDAFVNQHVVEYWYNGNWIKVEEYITLKDFINAWFKEVWGYAEPVVT